MHMQVQGLQRVTIVDELRNQALNMSPRYAKIMLITSTTDSFATALYLSSH